MDLALTALQFYHRCRLRVFLIFFILNSSDASNFLCFVVKSMRKDFMKNIPIFEKPLKLPRINQKKYFEQFVWAYKCTCKTLEIVWEKRMTCHIILLTIQLAREKCRQLNCCSTSLTRKTLAKWIAIGCGGFFFHKF